MKQSREDKLQTLQKRHRQLLSDRIPLQTDFKEKTKIREKSRRALDKINLEIREIGQQIYALKHDGPTPHVTDHAIVRYLERVKGVDVWKLKSELINHKNAVFLDNVVVTVNQELDNESDD
jgi:hypothetical protein